MRADRLLKLMMLLQVQGKMTTQSLADELEVSRRTILRDLDALSFAGIPIYTEGGHGGGVALDENYRVKLNGLNQAEVQALIVSNNARLLADIGLEDAADQSLLKLLSALPSMHAQAAKHMQNRILVDPIAWWRPNYRQTHLDSLRNAVFEDRLVAITYQKHNGEVVQRTVAPYGLVAKGSVWYLIASHDDRYRSYRVSRIRTMNVLDEGFSRDHTFQLDAYWQASVKRFVANLPAYRFTLRITDQKTRFVEWYTPGSFKVLEEPEDGWFVAEFEVETVDVALMLIFGLGNDVEILSPAELRDAYLQRVQSYI